MKIPVEIPDERYCSVANTEYDNGCIFLDNGEGTVMGTRWCILFNLIPVEEGNKTLKLAGCLGLRAVK